MKQRVCLDFRVCQKASRYTGTGIYAFNLTKALLDIKSNIDFWFLVLEGYPLPPFINKNQIITVKRPPKPQSMQEIFDLFDLKYLMRHYKISMFHSLVPGMISPSSNLPVIVTVHDIIPELIESENQGKLYKYLYKLKMKKVCKANHILVNSDATGIDLCKYYGINEEKVTKIYLSSQFYNYESISFSSKPWPRPYLLYLGGFNYRKNIPIILSSFSAIANEYPDLDLLIAGKPSINQGKELRRICSNLKIGKRIVWLDFVPDKDLPDLFKWSEAFIYPSIYEGFGMPVLEAMQFGAPVITSNKGSIPEIIGNAGIIIDPNSKEQLIQAIKNVLSNELIQNKLRDAGKEQAKKFSWPKCAEETLRIYEKILNRNYENWN